MFELPDGATLLASSEACRHQVFSVGGRDYGFQFDVELGRALASLVRPQLPPGLPNEIGPKRLLRIAIRTTYG